MTAGAEPFRTAVRTVSAVLVALMAHVGGAGAFPLEDPDNSTTLPGTTTDLAAPDVQDLRHQLQLTNPFAPGAAGPGWTILPRIDLNEMFNDNVLQANSPRRWDFETLVTPGVSIIGDLPRLQLKLDYAPTLELSVRDGNQNALIQQLNGTALVTAVPDFAFIDLRAYAGAQAANGLVGSGGSAANVGEAGGGSSLGTSSNTIGLAKNNRTQADNFSVSPYLLHTFGDYGTGKLGVSASVGTSDTTSGFAPLPYPSGNTQGSSLVATEEFAQFTSGDFLRTWQDTFNVDLVQSTTRTNQVVDAAGTISSIPNTTFGSSRQIVSDKLSYAVADWASAFITFGHENISYSTSGFRNINDFTWSVGTNVQPNPDSNISLSYGHQNGFSSFQANGRYALSARTIVSGGYSESLGTQLEEQSAEFQLGVIGPNGQFIDGSNGTPLLFNVFQAAVVPTVFHYHTFNLNVQTAMDRDTVSLAVVVSQQTTAGGTIQSSVNTKSATLQWQHELGPDLLATTYVGYTTQSQSGGQVCFGTLEAACLSNGGWLQSLIFGATLDYIVSETLSVHLRYLFDDRNSSVETNRMYQNLVVVGITKQF
jgi:hypothetical protein